MSFKTPNDTLGVVNVTYVHEENQNENQQKQGNTCHNYRESYTCSSDDVETERVAKSQNLNNRYMNHEENAQHSVVQDERRNVKNETTSNLEFPLTLQLPKAIQMDSITMQQQYHPDLAISSKSYSNKRSESNSTDPFQNSMSSSPSSPPSKYKFVFDHFKFRCCHSFCTSQSLMNWQIGIVKFVRKYFLLYPFTMFATWALFYILFGEDQAYPGGGLFSLFVLEVVAIILGELMDFFHLPPLLGMLGAGLLLKNLPDFISVANDLPSNLSSPLRAMSVVVLLTRGAYSVSPVTIKKFRHVVPHLAIMSCVIEAIAGSIAVYLIIQFPVSWSVLMGCIISAMSGAAVMPYLIKLDSQHGNPNNVVLIAKTACGLDAILAICLAECAFGFIFANGDLQGGLLKGIVEVLMGGAFGLLWGSLTGFLLDADNCLEIRTFAVFAGGCMSLLGLTTIGYPRGGPLGVFAGSLVTAIMWRYKGVDGKNNEKINENFTKIWFLFQPLLFGIIGSRIDLTIINWMMMSNAVICIAISLTVRLVTAVTMCSWTNMTLRQKMFIAISWIPKGTVQAALGPVALETMQHTKLDAQSEQLGYQVMTIAVLTIVMASSLGSILLLTCGPRVLKTM